MNVTLSADEDVVKRSRAFAAAHGTSLNQLVRDYMAQIANLADLEDDAREFGELAAHSGGRAPDGYTFDRDAIHRRNS